MKTNLVKILIATFVAVLNLNTWAQTNKFADGEKLAQATLLYVTDHYEGGISAQQFVGGSWKDVQMSFIMTKDLYITNLAINNTNILLTRPLGGILVPTNGFQYFQINLWAVDKNRNVGAEGYLYTNALFRGDKLVVTLNPKLPPVFIPARLDNPRNLRLIITGLDGYGWYYDFTRGGFVVEFYGEYRGSGEYQIVDEDGNILERGVLAPFNSPAQAGNGPTVVNVKLAGGIKHYGFESSYLDLYNQKFEATVERNGAPVKAAVLAVSGFNRMRFYAYAYNLDGAKVEVRRPNKSGSMDVVPVKVDDWGYGSVRITSEEFLDDAVITVIPQAGKESQSFYLYLSRW